MSSSQIKFIRPEKLNDGRILSWFSLKNQDLIEEGQLIPGLNIGFNSKERHDIILHNLKLLSDEIRTKASDIALAEQVHQTEVKLVSKGGIYSETDAFVSNTPGVALGIQVADCGAVLLGDSWNKVIGAAHAGWRGGVSGIIPKTVQQMVALGAETKRIKAFISPCLAVHNFEVGEEVSAQFPENLVDANSYEKPHVDLKGLIMEHLMFAGVLPRNIECDNRCTIDDEELFYSYRREKEKSGRMLGVIKLNSLK